MGSSARLCKVGDFWGSMIGAREMSKWSATEVLSVGLVIGCGVVLAVMYRYPFGDSETPPSTPVASGVEDEENGRKKGTVVTFSDEVSVPIVGGSMEDIDE